MEHTVVGYIGTLGDMAEKSQTSIDKIEERLKYLEQPLRLYVLEQEKQNSNE